MPDIRAPSPDHRSSAEDRPTIERDPQPPFRTFEQPARRVAGGRRSRATMAAWIVALGAIAIVGVTGRGGDDGTTARILPPSEPPPTSTVPAPSVEQVVVLSDPEPPPAAVTGIPLWVRGRAGPEVREVLLLLADGELRISRQTVRPTASGSFSAVFTLAPPRPEMDLTVIAVARDSGADAVGTARRPVLVSELRAAPGATPRPSLGEDGVLGSRGVDLAAVVAESGGPAGPSAARRPPGNSSAGLRPGLATSIQR